VRKSVIGTSPACVGVLALTGIILSGSPTHAADECLAAPNSSAPPGSHWYYHVDRSTQRKCWYVRQEDQQDQAGSKIQQAEKSSAATTTATTDEQIKASRQTERARTRPAAVGNKTQAGTSTSGTPEPTVVAAPAVSAADEQPTSFDQTDLSTMPSAPGSDPGTSTPAIQYSGPASAVSVTESGRDVSAAQGQSTITDQGLRDPSPQTTVYRADDTTESAVRSTTFTPIHVLLLIAIALALTGVLAFAIFPSRLRRWISAFRAASSTSGAIDAHEAASLNLNHAIAEPNRPAAQFDMTDELKQNLRQVLQTLEAQLRGDVEFEEAPLQRRSRKPAWG
jgi:hypothetical protein